jgi:hypothetical protein
MLMMQDSHLPTKPRVSLVDGKIAKDSSSHPAQPNDYLVSQLEEKLSNIHSAKAQKPGA